MSRHRNVRTMNYDEDYAGYDDVYGHSVEDDYCVSPSASHYLYDRNKSNPVSSFFPTDENIAEEHEPEPEDNYLQLESLTLEKAIENLVPEEEILLKSCMDEIRSVLGGEDVSGIGDGIIVGQVVKWKFDVEKALDAILKGNSNCEPPDKPPKSAIPPAQGPMKPSTGTIGTAAKSGPTIQDPTKDKLPKVITVAQPKPPTTTTKPPSIGTPNVRFVPAGASATLGFDLPSKTPGDSRGGSQTPSPVPPLGEESSSSSKKPSSSTTPFNSSIAITSYSATRENAKQLINLLVIGHVDAGKSTLMGHLLWQLGQVPKKTMHKFEQESKKIGKQSFMYAWVLDETGEERTRGITMDVGHSKFETPTKTVVLLDAPGHKDFIPNMITGASQADVAILVVDATKGEFETGFESGGQTREHAMLVRSLGVTQLVVAVNKLDTVEWSQSRFDEIKARLSTFLVKQAGFRDGDIRFVPCSGLIGENLAKKAEDKILISWYNGSNLLDAIDTFRPPDRPIAKPLRFTVSDIFKGQGGLCLAGRVETGMIQAGDKVLIQPSAETAIVKSITLDTAPSHGPPIAFAGDPCLLTLSTQSSDAVSISLGSILATPSHPCKVSSRFQARLVCFDAMTIPLTRGFTGVMHLGTVSEQIVVKKILWELSKGTGEVVKEKPRVLGRNANGIVEIQVSGRSLVMEEFKDVKELGRFTLRSTGVTVAAGVITKIL